MTQYIYFVKCPGCDDEPFDFFDEAKAFAMNCLTKKPIITQVECDYNDCGFGERTNTNDLGTVWSWEETMGDIPVDDGLTTFSKSETFDCDDDSFDCEFDDTPTLDDIPDNFRKPVFEGITDNTRAPLDSEFVIVSKHPNRNSYTFLGNNFRMTKQLDKAMPYSTKEEAEHDITYAEDISMESGSKYDRYTSKQFFVATVEEAKQLLDDRRWKSPEQLSIAGMTIEALVEEMEENEDTVECKVCEELFDKTTCRKDPKLGWVCEQCGGSIVEDANESAPWRQTKVALEYPELTITLQSDKRIVGEYPGHEEWDEQEETVVNFVYEADANDVAEEIWYMMTEQDAADVPGGLETLEDDKAFDNFLNTHLDDLVDKYYTELLDLFKEQAIEAATEDYYNDN